LSALRITVKVNNEWRSIGLLRLAAPSRNAPRRGAVDDGRYDAAAQIEAAVLTWFKAGNRTHKERDHTTLGTLRLDRSRLVIEVNSSRRRERIAKEIARRFGSTATLVETTTADIAKELHDRRARRGDTAELMTFPAHRRRASCGARPDCPS
jgi:hypothetical protein